MKYTPGPWYVHQSFDRTSPVVRPEDERYAIATVYYQYNRDEPYNATANASLIAAAPDLLEACELVEPAISSLLDELDQRKATDWGLVNDCLVKVTKAIKKTKGERE